MDNPMKPVRYEKLDPGIRETVRWLNDIGYETTDSGDGVSKCDVGRTFDFPHVFIQVEGPRLLIGAASRLRLKLEEKGIALDGRVVEVEASYLAGQRASTILVRGVNDEMLKNAKAA